jgi:hypothetical protein
VLLDASVVRAFGFAGGSWFRFWRRRRAPAANRTETSPLSYSPEMKDGETRRDRYLLFQRRVNLVHSQRVEGAIGIYLI